MAKSAGTAGTMPIEGSGCGVRPSKEAMEVNFGVDFSKAKDLLPNNTDEEPSITEKPDKNQASSKTN